MDSRNDGRRDGAHQGGGGGDHIPRTTSPAPRAHTDQPTDAYSPITAHIADSYPHPVSRAQLGIAIAEAIIEAVMTRPRPTATRRSDR